MSHSSPPHAGLKAGFAILVLGGLVAFYAVMFIGSSPFAAQAETEPCPGVSPLPFLIDRNANGELANGESLGGTISENGCTIAFTSYANNLVPGDTNNVADVFVFDRSTGKLSRVSVSQNNIQANGESTYPSLSADGRYVAFQSNATNIADRFDTNNSGDIFVHDRLLGTTTRLTNGNKASYFPTISLNGNYVAFKSDATNLVENDTNAITDVFVFDMVYKKMYRVSVKSGGEQAPASYCFGVICSGFSSSPPAMRILRFIAFDSASQIVPKDTNEADDVYLHQFVGTGITERISETTEGVQANADSEYPAISLDGRYVAFNSYGGLPGSTPGGNIYVRDGATGALTFVDKGKTQMGPSINADGRFIVYTDTEYIPGEVFEKFSVKAFDQTTGEKWKVGVNSAGELPDKGSHLGFRAISGSGTWTVFSSRATNLSTAVPPTNFQLHVYLTTTKLAF